MAAVLLAGCAGEGTVTARGAGAAGGSGPVPPSELVSAEGACGDAAAEGSAPGKLDFGLTECEVVRLAGPFDRVEIGDAQGVRVVTMVSTAGARPGIYRFEAGRLKSVEGAPEPEKKKGKPAPRH
ncbi:hypothetical protein [Blastochloris sulfoviridis]|uniref:Uncharacterized protein n=1 Tax=Blastochloris sulfoviridis TaxID=50712 RepID=A0A5M6I1Y0_9HYPH|nr:hypothetical protein [Blastochloris sulfoviridis]KAA5602210.1 hypothetical protein F1193_06145 [Blastochloris sulfoviridis]